MKQRRFPPKIKATLAGVGLLGLFAVLVNGVQHGSWNESSKYFCYFYAGIVTLFFLVQIVAFVLSHAEYSQEIEAPKYDMIVNEVHEWRGREAK